MSIRPRSNRKDTKTGRGQMAADDPRLLKIANLADQIGIKPAAAKLGISSTLVLRAMKVHGVKARPVGWHMRNQTKPSASN